MAGLLSVTNLSKRYRVGDATGGLVAKMLKRDAADGPSYLHAVDDISFEIEPGESLGVVGESGCGKSTLVNMLARLSDPTDGAILFDGRMVTDTPAAKFSTSEDRKLIQVVFQDPHESLNPRHTAFDSIAEPLLRLGGVKGGEELRARVAELARQTGIPEALLPRYPHQLSGGQKARVNIARAIALNPKLLILDEPTSALDVSVQAVILKLLDELRRSLGMSYMFVSHDLNVVRLLCDRVLVMYLGRIVEIGPSDEIFGNPRHPYTKALVSAIPRIDGDNSGRIRLTGEPRSPIDPDPNVCRFYGRCPIGIELCARKMPLLVPKGVPGHFAACHFADDA